MEVKSERFDPSIGLGNDRVRISKNEMHDVYDLLEFSERDDVNEDPNAVVEEQSK